MEEGALFVGIITTSGQFFSRVARRGELFVVPRGLLHFELNIGFEIATFFASFNSQNPGVIRFVTALFNSTPPVPEEVLTAAFRVSNATIDEIRRNVTGNPYVKQYYLRH
ncbi:OLC1v1003411C1 [Oldenlandia corymbosa var. corymbosa]|uniref:Germin-like protein n=1 Tax=Oldenlandia corymbosa var. corymbosa TaxID=529605 RepID=A0AAV1DCZ5_OLDCO|nr:OLC1v1003411C1 [Oldenlandia corymbosa var. corymbosa]